VIGLFCLVVLTMRSVELNYRSDTPQLDLDDTFPVIIRNDRY